MKKIEQERKLKRQSLGLQERLGFRSDFRILEVEETSSTICNLSFSFKNLSFVLKVTNMQWKTKSLVGDFC